jgi:hypothetical protein
MRTLRRGFILAFLSISAVSQTKPAAAPVQATGTSTFTYSKDADGAENVETRNVSFEVTDANIPGRPHDQPLVLRKTTHSKRTFGDMGEDAHVMLEAWPVGVDLKQKPLYSINVTGTDGRTLDNAFFVADRAVEETDWWSVYKLGTGQHLFDTYVPIVSFSITRDTIDFRYVGLQVAVDDVKEPRLKAPNVVGVLSYASASKLVRELLVTCDDPKQAPQLRSLADETRTLIVADSSRGKTPSYSLKLTFSNSYPAAPNPIDVVIPVVNDDLDVAHAQLPAHLHLATYVR